MPHPDVHEANFPNMLVATGSSRSLDLLMLVLACGPTSGRSSSCLRCCRVPGAGCWSPRSGAGAGSAVERIHLGLVLVVLVPGAGHLDLVLVPGPPSSGSTSGWCWWCWCRPSVPSVPSVSSVSTGLARDPPRAGCGKFKQSFAIT